MIFGGHDIGKLRWNIILIETPARIELGFIRLASKRLALEIYPAIVDTPLATTGSEV